MSFQVTVTPSGRQFDVAADESLLAAAIRAGVGLPYGCKDGACGSCKCRLLSGEVTHGPHAEKALSAAEQAQGLILTCRAQALSDCTLEARGVTRADEFPVLKMPGRVLSIVRRAADVAVLRVQLPANQHFRYHAGQYVDFILRDGARRSYSMANSPTQLGEPPSIELHIRHLPGGLFTDHVFGAMKERDIVRMEGPFGSFFLRSDSAKPLVLLAAGTGFAPIKALIEQLRESAVTRPVHLYWGGRRRADLYLDDWAAAAKIGRAHV